MIKMCLFSAVCLAGQYYYTDTVTVVIKCNLCDIGTFNPSVMVDECQTCPDGKSTLLPGAKSSDQCISKYAAVMV